MKKEEDQKKVDTLFKALRGSIAQSGWTGPVFPNASTNWIGGDAVHACTRPANATSAGKAAGKAGCLFELSSDPGEHNDIALLRPDVLAQMLARMDEIEATTYVPDRGADTGEACTAAMARGGYFGPFLS